MTKQEMRFIRREFINSYIQVGYTNVVVIMALVRISETIRHGQEMKVYTG